MAGAIISAAMTPAPAAIDLPLLYSFRRCPYAMRARLALRACGLTVRLREVLLRDKPPELLALNPAGTVPVLQLPDGQVLLHSLDIMRWAFARRPPAGWAQPQGATQNEQEAQWLQTLDGAFKRALDGYKYPERHPSLSAEAWRDQAVAALLQSVQHHLQTRNTAFMWGDQPSLLDLALWPFVRQLAQVDAAWWAGATGLEDVRAWLQRGLALPLFESVMGKYPAWHAGETEPRF
jgi:glutathione S-transferase